MLKRSIVAALSVTFLLSSSASGQPDTDEAYEFAVSSQEKTAHQALQSIWRANAHEVDALVADFLDTYPGSKWRRDARYCRVRAYASMGNVTGAVDECTDVTMHLKNDRLGDMIARNCWLQLGDLFEKAGRYEAAARVRLLCVVDFPYQLENGEQLVVAVQDLARAGLYAEMLPVAKLALALIERQHVDEVVGLTRKALRETQGDVAADQFIAYWKYGRVGMDGAMDTEDDCVDPLARVELPEGQRLMRSAKAALNAEGLLARNDATMSMQKGVLNLLAGEYDAAASELLRAVSAAEPAQKEKAAYQAAAFFRLIDGHDRRSAEYVRYVRWGKDGPDGLPSTGDDVVNPFEEGPTLGGT